jgi:hypothetical protein
LSGRGGADTPLAREGWGSFASTKGSGRMSREQDPGACAPSLFRGTKSETPDRRHSTTMQKLIQTLRRGGSARWLLMPNGEEEPCK